MRQEDHPAFGLDHAALEGPRLAGPYPQGVAAAHVEAGQGKDGRWCSRWSFATPTTGSATPIVHSEPFDSKRAAIEARLILIRDKARRIQAARPDCYSDRDREWCRKIEAWATDQLAPQQMGLGF